MKVFKIVALIVLSINVSSFCQIIPPRLPPLPLPPVVDYLFIKNVKKNLDKYVAYRGRLRKFVVAGIITDQPGRNLPASRISQDLDTLVWDDGNGAFPTYLAVLATEYRLLKNSGNPDYVKTLRELYWALKSFDRLDTKGETYWREDKSPDPRDINGCFLRQDIDSIKSSQGSPFWQVFKSREVGGVGFFEQKYYAINGDCFANLWKQGPNFASIDVCQRITESFALINALVENETINGEAFPCRQMARDYLQRILNYMYHKSNPLSLYDCPFYFTQLCPMSCIEAKSFYWTWYLKYPWSPPYDLSFEYKGSGRDGTSLFTSLGFANIGNRIFGTTYRPKVYLENDSAEYVTKKLLDLFLERPMDDKSNLFNLVLIYTAYGDWFHSICPGFALGKVFAYSDVISNKLFDVLDVQIGIERHPCWVLKRDTAYIKPGKIRDCSYKTRSACALGSINATNYSDPYQILINIQNKNIILKNEHLALIYSILYNKIDIAKNDEINQSYLISLLDDAPAEGPWSIYDPVTKQVKYGNERWTSINRLVWPPKPKDPNPGERGYFNGLDYMLLHNLYFLVYSPRVPYRRSNPPSSYVSQKNYDMLYKNNKIKNWETEK